LYLRLIATDTSVVMPPPFTHLTVSADEIEIIRKWIEQGAEYQRHWAFIPPEKSSPPELKSDWVTNEIDAFILAKMQEFGLRPNPEADKERLLKRLSFDLTGLPPSIELQDRFLADDSPVAYERMVDELLASHHY